MVSFSLLGLQHPEPNGSRRATPTSTFQHRPGHPPAADVQDRDGGLTLLASLFVSYVRKLVTELSGGVFGYLDSVLERHSFDEFGELI